MDATIITGGGKGIGESIAYRMAQEGPVVLVGRDELALSTVCYNIKSSGKKASYIVGDVTNPETAQCAVVEAISNGWVVTNLVCNAGIGKGGPIESIDSDDWNTIFNVNVNGTFNFIQACLPIMKLNGKGSISIISSIAGLKGVKNDSAYSASKAALISIAQSVAAETKKLNIPVVAICPGYVDGSMTERSIKNLIEKKGTDRIIAREILAGRNIQGRILKASEVAEAVAFVSTAAGMRFTGEAMLLSGESDARILKLVNWITKSAKDATKLVIPVSGGSDSAFVYKLCAMAYPDKVYGVYFGSREDLRGYEFLSALGHINCAGPIRQETDRWALLLNFCKKTNGWLVGSRNRTEDMLGTYSMASRVATYYPIINVWKSEVMELARIIGVPNEILESSKKADPDCGRPQEMAEIPFELVDAFLIGRKHMLNDGQIEYLTKVYTYNKFKAELPTKGPSV